MITGMDLKKKKKDMNDSKMIFFKNVELCSLSSGHLQGGIESGWLAQIESAFYYSLIINTLCDISPTVSSNWRELISARLHVQVNNNGMMW